MVFEDTAAVTLRDLKEERGGGGHGGAERYCSEIFCSLLLAVLRCWFARTPVSDMTDSNVWCWCDLFICEVWVTRSGFLATYWVPGAIGHWILKPEYPILTKSQSSLGVPQSMPGHSVSSPAGARRWIFWKLPFEQIELQAQLLNYFLGSNKSNINQSGILVLPTTPLENDPTPFTNPRF